MSKKTIFCLTMLTLVFLTSSSFSQWKDWNSWNRFAKIEGLTEVVLPLLFLDTLGVDSTELIVDWKGQQIDSFFIRWDTTSYPLISSGTLLASGDVNDTLNLYKWDYSVLYSDLVNDYPDTTYDKKSIYVSAFVKDTLGSVSRSRTYLSDPYLGIGVIGGTTFETYGTDSVRWKAGTANSSIEDYWIGFGTTRYTNVADSSSMSHLDYKSASNLTSWNYWKHNLSEPDTVYSLVVITDHTAYTSFSYGTYVEVSGGVPKEGTFNYALNFVLR